MVSSFGQSLALSQPILAGKKYGPHKIDTRSGTPARLKWEDVRRVVREFKESTGSKYEQLLSDTHGLFYDRFDDYFPLLSDNQKEALSAEYPEFLAGTGPRSHFTFEEIFQIGDAPPDLLFPLGAVESVCRGVGPRQALL